MLQRRGKCTRPGPSIQLDIKKLWRVRGTGHCITGQGQHWNRRVGWGLVHVHVARLAYSEVLASEMGATSAVSFRGDAA